MAENRRLRREIAKKREEKASLLAELNCLRENTPDDGVRLVHTRAHSSLGELSRGSPQAVPRALFLPQTDWDVGFGDKDELPRTRSRDHPETPPSAFDADFREFILKGMFFITQEAFSKIQAVLSSQNERIVHLENLLSSSRRPPPPSCA